MAINVMFDKNGFYHPVYGRLGRGRNQGRVYALPDEFATNGMLPATATIVEDEDELEDILEEEGQRRPTKPQVLNEEQAEKITGAGRKRKAASAKARTTGSEDGETTAKTRRTRARKKPAS